VSKRPGEPAGALRCAALVGVAVCPACATGENLKAGGHVPRLDSEPAGTLFPVGPIDVTPGAARVLAEGRESAADYVRRHAAGDWGQHGRFESTDVSPDELRDGAGATDNVSKPNKVAVLTKCGEVMSEYRTARGKVISYVGAEPQTTVMLPDEY
jgi:hypothetical protein